MRKIYTLFLSLLVVSALTVNVGCEGPEGPAGADGSESCSQCHNEGTAFTAKQTQFASSAHSLGTYHTRGGQCAGCHSTEGFLTRENFTSIDEIDDLGVDDQTPIGCRTCHNTHMEYDSTDWSLTFVDQVTETLFGYTSPDHDSYSFDDYGSSNQCLQCHQSRDQGNVPGADATDSVSVSTYWGPHYGVQGNVIHAQAGIHVAGDSYTEGAHSAIENACVSCHMYKDNHDLVVSYDACAPCHQSDPDVAEAATDALHTEIHDLMFDLGALLVTKGVMLETIEDGEVVGYYPVGGYGGQNIGANESKAVWNYMVVYQDHSYGVHNPGYTRALLNNSIALVN